MLHRLVNGSYSSFASFRNTSTLLAVRAFIATQPMAVLMLTAPLLNPASAADSASASNQPRKSTVDKSTVFKNNSNSKKAVSSAAGSAHFKNHKTGLLADAQPASADADQQAQSKESERSDSSQSAHKENKMKDADSSSKTSTSESAKDKENTEVVKNNDYAREYFEQERQARKRKYAHSSSTVQIYAPQAAVWKVLIDFEHYPSIFKRIESCHITKREHGLLFAETYLKPQTFVKKLCQHTVTDISQAPNFLQWKMLDGNFAAVLGSWTLTAGQDKKGKDVCVAKYTLEADPGPVIPGPMVAFMLHQVEHEVVTSFKKTCEQAAAD